METNKSLCDDYVISISFICCVVFHRMCLSILSRIRRHYLGALHGSNWAIYLCFITVELVELNRFVGAGLAWAWRFRSVALSLPFTASFHSPHLTPHLSEQLARRCRWTHSQMNAFDRCSQIPSMVHRVHNDWKVFEKPTKKKEVAWDVIGLMIRPNTYIRRAESYVGCAFSYERATRCCSHSAAYWTHTHEEFALDLLRLYRYAILHEKCKKLKQQHLRRQDKQTIETQILSYHAIITQTHAHILLRHGWSLVAVSSATGFPIYIIFFSLGLATVKVTRNERALARTQRASAAAYKNLLRSQPESSRLSWTHGCDICRMTYINAYRSTIPHHAAEMKRSHTQAQNKYTQIHRRKIGVRMRERRANKTKWKHRK